MPRQTLITLGAKLLSLFFSSLFPNRCYGCDCYDTFLCDTCRKLIPRRDAVTRLTTPHRSSSSLDSVTSALYFKTPIVSQLIHDFKFQGLNLLADTLTSFLLESLERSRLPLPHIITEVPLHSKRLRERGYNQSSLLATQLALTLNTPLPILKHLPLLKRTRATRPQSKQPDRKTRLSAMENAFELLRTTDTLAGQVIWLIDDVTTTGATLEACAQVLKQAGAKEVHGIVVAR